MTMKLYMHPAACSLSPHIVSRELDLPVDVIEVDRKTHETPDGIDYFRINGNGYVPALALENGKTLIEGPAIVQYLADLRPEAGLLPPVGTFERTEAQSWLNFITSELHKPMAMLFHPDYAPAQAALRALVDKRLDWLSSRFVGPYLTGEHFTVADAYLFVCLNWSPWIKIDLARWPVLAAFMARVAARPKVQMALEEEDLVKFGPDELFHGPRALVEPSQAAEAARS